MIIINNKLIPFKGFSAMAICPILFVRKDAYLSEKTIRHEKIHFAQQKETFALGLIIALFLIFVCNLSYWYMTLPFTLYYCLYFVMWLWNLTNVSFDGKKGAYRRIPFEKEAYSNNI